MRTTSDPELLSEAVRSVPADDTPARLRRIAETIERGTNTVTSPSPRPRPRPAVPTVGAAVEAPIEYEGAYYTLVVTDAVEQSLLEAKFRIGVATPSPDGTANSVAYDDLPAADRSALEAGLPPDHGDDGYVTTVAYYDERGRSESVFVPEAEYDAVVLNDRRYPIELANSVEMEGYNYHYEAERVASTDEEFLSWLRSEYRFDLTGLPEAEREIVTEAIEESAYFGSGDDAFESLSERLLSRPAIERDEFDNGEWFVRYDGTEYLAELDAP